MKATKRLLLTSCAVLFLVTASAPVQAETITASDVVRVTFNLDDYENSGGFPLGTLDYFEFAVFLNAIDPVTSFTASLFNGSELLGTYTSPFTTSAISRFVSATSQYAGNAAVIDFSSFNDATIDGRLELSIQGGSAVLIRTSDELSVGIGVPNGGITSAIFPTSFQVISTTPPPAVPEPATMLLTASGLAMAAYARRRRRG